MRGAFVMRDLFTESGSGGCWRLLRVCLCERRFSHGSSLVGVRELCDLNCCVVCGPCVCVCVKLCTSKCTACVVMSNKKDRVYLVRSGSTGGSTI